MAAVSIRAPARGATVSCGGRQDMAAVSIRAPARGATNFRPRGPPPARFQFALPRGERRRILGFVGRCRCFNSRSREGSDVSSTTCCDGAGGFNSRSREGSDIPVDDRPYIDRLVSIRAPARGATCLVFLVGVLIRGFNSRSREGSDPLRLTNQKDKICFNSRSREGSDAARGTGRGRRRGFNSRSREGSDTC